MSEQPTEPRRLTISEQIAAEEAASEAYDVTTWVLSAGFMGQSYAWLCNRCGALVANAQTHHAWHTAAS